MRRAPYKRRRNQRLRADDLFDDLPRTTSAGPEPVASPAGRVRVEYGEPSGLPDDVLCVIHSGGYAGAAPLSIDVRLQRLGGPAADHADQLGADLRGELSERGVGQRLQVGG